MMARATGSSTQDRSIPEVARILAERVMRIPRAWPRFDVGHYRALERLARVEAARLAEGGRVVTAGDYRADPSWEGAFAAGLRAARTAHAAGKS